ncbi:hypothetical protein Curi_c15070 [Gottschalkia acidurici 9a]|uniref:Uncharacterized protein n=1 Tax=Gottschalkia acidurici (strain ATCC 7906 / DSM 604 / BCRC 14475 / CIP 104303 / KCTC 5404 / NCIMB 10678 / 9a) TaxID=1128398 RepID=K0B1G2_GOTA9|nr:hypothetical protein [Gottschalkia acidurici]AFS78516.1 hypothetical protein Curi_c15070 [Gottschalkia acidurici 9a]
MKFTGSNIAYDNYTLDVGNHVLNGKYNSLDLEVSSNNINATINLEGTYGVEFEVDSLSINDVDVSIKGSNMIVDDIVYGVTN